MDKTRSVVLTVHPGSPDIFLTCCDELRFGRISSSTDPVLRSLEEYKFANNCIFSADGRSLAIKNGHYELILANPDDGEQIVAFETAGSGRILGLDFSLDANFVAIACYDNLQILDLSKVRAELARLGLDW